MTPQAFSPAADRNKTPILTALQALLPGQGKALEIASGTEQSAHRSCSMSCRPPG